MNASRLTERLMAPAFLPACFAVYALLRVLVLFVTPLEQQSDFLWYYDRAEEISSGIGYSERGILTAFWPVGWPGFLGILFTLTGPSVLAGQIANLVFSCTAFQLTLMLVTRFHRDCLAARIAVLVLTLLPNQIGYMPLLSTEIYFEFLLLAGVLLLEPERVPHALGAGFVFGLATLTKAQSLLIPVALFCAAYLASPSWVRLAKLSKLLAFCLAMTLVVVSPWTLRNYRVFGAFIPVSTNGGWTLLTGNNPEARGDYTPNTVLAQGISHNPELQVAMDQEARGRAFTWMRQNPLEFMSLIPLKLYRLWVPDGESEWFFQSGFRKYDKYFLVFRAIRFVNQLCYIGICILAIWWLVAKRTSAVNPWSMSGVVLFGYFSLVSVVFSGQSRFHFSLIPFICCYASLIFSHRLSNTILVTYSQRNPSTFAPSRPLPL